MQESLDGVRSDVAESATTRKHLTNTSKLDNFMFGREARFSAKAVIRSRNVILDPFLTR